MRKITSIFFVLAFLVPAIHCGARSGTLDRFIDKVSTSLVSFDYSFSMLARKSRMKGEGKVRVQDNAFFMEGNGLEIWCDGKTRWTIDRVSEEAVVETVGASESDYSTNPALLLTSVDDAFLETAFGPSDFAGKAVDASTLSPVRKGKYSMDIALLKLFFKSGTSELAGAEVTLNDGTVSEFRISGIRFEEKTHEKGSFRFDEKTLNPDYVVTDLR